MTSYTGFQTAIDSGAVYDDADEYADEMEDWESVGSQSESRHLLWSNGHSLDQDSIQLEVKMHKILSERWLKQQQRRATVNVTLNLETDLGHLLSVTTSATLKWPTLISGTSEHVVRFPLIKFGSSVTKEIFIENPSSHPLSVQAVVARPSLYPKDFITSLNSWSGADWTDMDQYGSAFKVVVNGETGFASRMITIPVGQRIRVGIVFEPLPNESSTRSRLKSSSTDSATKVTGMLLIRNNLTIFDSLRLEGESGQGLLRIGKDAPALTSILTLDVSDKHLSSNCKRRNTKSAAASLVQISYNDQSRLMFQKEFSLINFGKIAVTVRGYLIGPHVGVSSSSYKSKSTLASLSDEPIGSNGLLSALVGQLQCEGFGFRVLNCESADNNSRSHIRFEPFVLKPNASRKISIAFTPDFTIAKSMATLTVITDDGPDPVLFQKNWIQVLEQHFLPSASLVATSRKWLSILTTGSTAATQSQEWMWGSSFLKEGQKHPPTKSSTELSGLHLITYSLIATVPKSLLSACDQSLPRPYQEEIMYYTLLVFMVCLVTVTCVFAFMDGTRVLNFSFYPAILMTRPAGEFDAASIDSFKPFDLNEVPTKKTASDGNKNADARQNGSWTSYLKSKLVSPRRGSGSSASSVSGDGCSKAGGTSGLTGTKSGPKGSNNKNKKNPAKGSAVAEEAAVSSLRRRLNAKSWFETLSNRNREEKETVKIPLPTFEDEFDDQDIQNLKGKKGKNQNQKQSSNKKEKDVTPLAPSSSPSSTGTSTASGSSSPVAPVLAACAASTLVIPVAAGVRDHSSSSARTSPKTICCSSGMGSFELPYNPGKGRRCESLSSVPTVDAFSHNGSYKESPASDFGFWDPDNVSSKSSIDNNMEIWDSPITMFDPQKALQDLSKKQAAASGRNRSGPIEKKQQQDVQSAVSKSALCAFPNNATSAAFPTVGLFDAASLHHRQVQTPSPRGWSPSHKSLQVSMSVPAPTDYSTNRTTPSPVATTWDADKDVLSRLRESSTDWIRGPTLVTTPVQRPQNGSMWPDAVPGGGRGLSDKTNGFWPNAAAVESKVQAEMSSSWNPLSGGTGFSFFGRSLWSPIPPPPGMSSPTIPATDLSWSSGPPDDQRRN